MTPDEIADDLWERTERPAPLLIVQRGWRVLIPGTMPEDDFTPTLRLAAEYEERRAREFMEPERDDHE